MANRSRLDWRKIAPVLIAVVAGSWLGKDTVLALQAFLNTIVGAY